MKTLLIIMALLALAFTGWGQTIRVTEGGTTGKKNALTTVNDEDKGISKDIVNDLFALGIIRDTLTVAFVLSDTKMKVNDQVQPAEVLKKFTKKYNITAGQSITHSRAHESTSTITITE